MMQNHSWSLFELESMMPWEREVYIGLLIEHLEDEKEMMERNKYKKLSRGVRWLHKKN